MNEYQHTNISNNSNILVYVGSNVTLQCSCGNTTEHWYYNRANNSDGVLTLVSVKQSNSGVHTCMGQIHNVPFNINITVYSKSICIEHLTN